METTASAILANSNLVLGDWALQFSYNRKSDRVIVKGRFGRGSYVVHEISPEKYLDFLTRFEDLIGTLLGGPAQLDC